MVNRQLTEEGITTNRDNKKTDKPRQRCVYLYHIKNNITLW